MSTPPTIYSHLTQVMLNYYPDTDIRVRENPVTVVAQLLNSIANPMELQNMQIQRELRALNLSDVPMNIDNGGVYYGALVPLSFNLPYDAQGNLLPPTTIKGQIVGGPLVTLTAYDDTLPVPTRIYQDSSIPAVALSNPQLINVTGDGVTPFNLSPGVLPLPNAILFTVHGMGSVTTAFSVSITGYLNPPAIWPQDIKTRNEVLVISDDGFYQTDSVWYSISNISITGLPAGCQLIGYVLGVQLPAEQDTDRPFTHPAYRGVTFPRFWQLDDVTLKEVYKRNRFSGYETYQTYQLPTTMVDCAVEPNTNGLFLTDGTNLIYVDRRTPMPANLLETGHTSEPAYTINVWYDYNQPGDTKYAYISPVAMAQASTVTQWRYVVEDPNGNLYVLLPNGILQQYSGTGGWNDGYPTPVAFPLTVIGTWLISLETLGTYNAKTTDTFPFGNFTAQVKTTISLAAVVPSIQGIAFDSYDKLWAWTGQFAIPLKISYDAYVWDPSTRTIYATDDYSSVTIS